MKQDYTTPNNDLIVKDYDEIEEIPGFPKVPLGKATNLKGKKFNNLTPLYRTENRGRKVMWVCQCDCDNIIKTDAYSLTSGHTTSCGCTRSKLLSDAVKIKKNEENTGKKFGRLTIISYEGESVYKCQCDCGNIVYVNGNHLFSGHTTSCGCYKRELLSERSKMDIAGQKFGKLTALYPIKSINNVILWHCKCDCGNEIDVLGIYLTSGHRLSCGCLKSKGEQLIQDILQKNNISYICQKSFDQCVFNSGKKAIFDFFIDNRYLVEYDGEQHFRIRDGFFSGQDNFESIKKRDSFKNQWCKENNIPLIRIPYWHYDNLCLEDLLLETTQFRVV